ncbi:Hypothetical predicted protein [Olea europaea subsp. europaea]|uniref:Uncharacterized protein n=1 Tax=Olea europaea subsp. europaea TaxID=158383 RepID=A0A8S0QTW0_OLEEU|nr:Hypothetical predicted protein [Olea europaea subsp. europaea]
MASRRPFAVLIVLFLMVVSAASRRHKDGVKVGNIQHLDIEGLRGDGEASVVELKLVERRMTVVLTDYEGTGANNNHDPIPPGKF